LSLNSSRDIQETQKVANDHHQGIRQQNLEKRKETTQTLGSKSVSRKLSQQHESQEESKIEIMQGSIEKDDNLNIHYQRDETMIRRIDE
jgi:spore cortex formation protein SpoVR/YcgB (stage V sporulation)